MSRNEPLGRRSRLRRVLLALAVACAALAAWVAADLNASRRTSLRDFDPDEVARLETAMWRAYYERRRATLFLRLAELMRTQYRMPFWRSNKTALSAARAAFVFKDGRARADYERALPGLRDFYAAVRDTADTDFDVDEAARLELEWWIVHRERKRRQPGDLDRALAALASELYRVPAERLAEHARLRAAAMSLRDDTAERGRTTEADWRRIDDLLHQSWRSLHQAVNRGRPPR